jgi:integrase
MASVMSWSGSASDSPWVPEMARKPQGAPGRMYGDARCARTGTGRWSRRWRWAGCAAVRSSGCGWVICGSGSGAFIAEGKGGHQRVIPVSARFYAEVSSYLEAGRPADPGTDKVFVVLKGPRRGRLLAGVPVHVVSQRLGHASPVVTMTVYAHVLPGSQREAANLFARRIEAA